MIDEIYFKDDGKVNHSAQAHENYMSWSRKISNETNALFDEY
jgi:hypothetical protein